jgi:hypothetical protein
MRGRHPRDRVWPSAAIPIFLVVSPVGFTLLLFVWWRSIRARTSR